MSFAIANNMLTPSTMVIDLKISHQTQQPGIILKKTEDGSSSMKHPKKCSYTIPKNPLEDKQGAMAKT
jgi:hypothetical protein